tara:strand:+ start:1580 stop:3217 length:1638 start_codon:yes stop_codon:yes gene_type:complete
MKLAKTLVLTFATAGSAVGSQEPLWRTSLDDLVTYCYGIGWSLDGSQDFDGDGVVDVVSGSPFCLFTGGGVQVLSGATGTPLLEVEGSNPIWAQFLGRSVVALEDLDVDGVPDFAAMAGSQALLSRVYSGSTGDMLYELPIGSDFNLGVPNKLARIQDLDGDGVEDLLIGGLTEVPSTEHVARVYSGATGTLVYDLPSPVSGLTPQYSAYFGFAVAAADDLDGDGIEDILVGSIFAVDPASGNGTGAVCVFSGASGGLVRVDYGRPGWGHHGACLKSVPDQDGDGSGDYLVSSPLVVPSGSGSSIVELKSGATGATLWTVDVESRDFDLIGDFTGNGMLEWASLESSSSFLSALQVRRVRTGQVVGTIHGVGGIQSFVGAGDVNGDGFGDLFIGHGSSGVRLQGGCARAGSVVCTSFPNSTGRVAGIDACLAGDRLTLTSLALPAGEIGVWLASTTTASAPLHGGVLCVGLPFLRIDQGGFAPFFGPTVSPLYTYYHQVTTTLDLGQLPQGATVTPGETWRFQFWFSDQLGVGSGNFSDAIEITF